jgi:4-diphosphocytidyl-2-C-methyl-D-erythritol kinase
MIEEKAYAKINLSLEVLPTREDGYHSVNTIMVPISLYDELSFFESPDIMYRSNIEIEDDIVLKALKLFYEKYNIKDGVGIILEKHIPLSSGMAGGSSDAAACLRGLNRFFNINAPLKELEEIANKLGSDVSYCLYQSPAYCTGRGEKVELIESNLHDIDLTLIEPDFGISTAAIYKAYTYDGINRDEAFKAIKEGLKNNDLAMVKSNIFNDLGKISIYMTPLRDIYDDLLQLGFIPFLSGSGPTLYIFGNADIEEVLEKYKGLNALKCKLV